MNAEFDLDRQLASWFASDAPPRAPDRVLAVALERVERTGQRRRIRPGLRVGWSSLTPTRRLALAVGLLVAVLAGALLAGALFRTPPGDPPATLVVTRPDGPLPADGITVVAIAPDGAERTLAHFGSDQLDGTFSGWPAPTTMSGDGYLAISTLVASGASIVQVADLRDSAAPVQIPDAEGWAGYWGPTGRLALTQNDGSIAIFDPATGRTDRVLVPPGVRVLEFPGLRWSETGGVLAQDDDIASNPTNVGYRGLLGEIRLDGAFEPGPVPEVEDGVGPRRTRPSGERLRCNVLEETTCDSDDTLMSIGDGVDEVWTETDPDLRIADYAWTRDGDGLWALLESVGAGPRQVFLERISLPDGERTRIAAFAAGADDPDPGAWITAGSFAGIAPDDSRIVIVTYGDPETDGGSYIVDTEDGSVAGLDGQVAGWLREDTLTRSRPSVERVVPAPDELRGEWVANLVDDVGPVRAGTRRLTIRGTSAMLDANPDDPRIAFAIGSVGRDRVRLTQRSAMGRCSVDGAGTYAWSTDGDGVLRLTVVEDSCAERRALFGRSFLPALPYPDTSGAPAPTGRRLVVPELGTLSIVVPSEGQPSVFRHGFGGFRVSRTADDPLDATVTILHIERGVSDLCEGYGTEYVLGSGIRGALAQVERLSTQGLRYDPEPTTVAGRPAVTGTLTIDSDASCAYDSGPNLWSDHGTGWDFRDGDRMTIVEAPDGTTLAIHTNGASDAGRDWADQLVASISFERFGP
jgi:hypothetical protein